MESIVEIFIREIMASPTVTKIMLGMTVTMLLGISLFLWWGSKQLFKYLGENYKVFRQEIKLINYKIDATDHALAYSFKNGYKDERDKKFNELKDNDDFINDK